MYFRRIRDTLYAVVLGLAVLGGGIVQINAEPLVVIAPTEGEQFKVGDTMTISWTIDLDSIDIDDVIVLSYSPDGGISQYEIRSDLDIVPENTDIFDGPTATVEWIIPDTVTQEFLDTVSSISDNGVIVVDAPYGTYAYMEISGSFSITAAAPVTWAPRASGTVNALTSAVGPGGDVAISIHSAGGHTLEIRTMQGRTVYRLHGRGARQYALPQSALAPGAYIVNAWLAEGAMLKSRFCVLH